jgi:hypothetical protein
MAHHTVFPERARIYTSVDDMVTDGFTTTDPAVRCVQTILSQNPKVERVVVGREENTDKQIIRLTPVAVNLTDYVVTINGTDFTYTSDATAAIAEITAGLKTVIDLGSEPVTTTDNSTSLDIEANTVADQFTLAVNSRALLLQKNNTPDNAPNGIVEDLVAVRDVNDEWYALHLTNPSQDVIEAAAAYIETLSRIMITSTADDEVYNSGVTTDVMSELSSSSYDKTATLYHPDAYNTYPGAGWAGVNLPEDPGSVTWKFTENISGVAVTSLTTTEIANIEAKNGNTYVEIGGIAITQQGIMASGEFIDITRGIHFMEARLQENIYGRLANAKKVPFTDAGIGLIESEVWGVLRTSINQGILAADPEPTVTAPLASEVDAIDKTNRYLRTIEFEATLAGAIHKVRVVGTVTV